MTVFPKFKIKNIYIYIEKIWELYCEICHLSHDPYLNSDGQLFHQYQQKQRSPSPQLSEHIKKIYMILQIQVLGWARNKNVAG